MYSLAGLECTTQQELHGDGLNLVTLLESIPFLGNLISWYKTRRDEKRAAPVVTAAVEQRRSPIGVIDLILIVRTDATITDVTGSYSATTSIPLYATQETSFHRDALYAGAPLEERVLRIKVIPADALRKKEADVTVPIHLKYRLKTGEQEERYWKAELGRGLSEFQVTEQTAAEREPSF